MFNAIKHITNQCTILAHLDPLDNLYKFDYDPSRTPCHSPTVSTIRRYATTAFKSLAEEVEFWHCNLGHVDVEVMIQFFSSPSMTESHPHLTPSVLRKYFPRACPDCPIGNLQMRHPPFVPTDDSTPGDTWEVDFKGKWTNTRGRPVKTFGRHLYTFTAIDSA